MVGIGLRIQGVGTEFTEFTADMPVPIRVAQNKNIWVAAGDGDLVRVQVRHLRQSPAPIVLTPIVQELIQGEGEIPARCFVITEWSYLSTHASRRIVAKRP